MLVALLDSAASTFARDGRPAVEVRAAAELGPLRPLVRAVVAAVLREAVSHPDVEDAVQETLRRAIESRSWPAGATRPWLLGIARHVALDALRMRRRDRARRADGDAAPESATGRFVERLADPSVPVDDALDAAQREALVARALSRLPDGPRRALELFHAEGLGYSAIAEQLGVPLGTVATWVTRGRRALAEVVAQEPSESANVGRSRPQAAGEVTR
jgi:RNA polymerase sigma-70 factor (ECF subfamily)